MFNGNGAPSLSDIATIVGATEMVGGYLLFSLPSLEAGAMAAGEIIVETVMNPLQHRLIFSVDLTHSLLSIS